MLRNSPNKALITDTQKVNQQATAVLILFYSFKLRKYHICASHISGRLHKLH